MLYSLKPCAEEPYLLLTLKKFKYYLFALPPFPKKMHILIPQPHPWQILNQIKTNIKLHQIRQFRRRIRQTDQTITRKIQILQTILQASQFLWYLTQFII